MSERTVWAGPVLVAYPAEEQETGELMVDGCEAALKLADEMWGLDPPADCRVTVMTSPLRFVFRSAPWAWRLVLGVTLPLWFSRVWRTWPYSAGWTQRYGRRVVIGIKPPRLLAQADRRAGARIFVDAPDQTEKVRHVACHELIHACSAHLRLPMWLNEGLAMVTVDRFLAKQTVRQDTLDLVRRHEPKGPPPTYQALSRMGHDALAYHAARGYWLVRYLEDVQPGLLARLFAESREGAAVQAAIINVLGLLPADFWREIDRVLVDHFVDIAPGEA